MKKNLPLAVITAIVFLLPSLLIAQPPQAFSYQTVVRDDLGNPRPSTPVTFRFTISTDTTPGTAPYVETQSTTTNSFGLVSLAIGRGTVVWGAFSSIPWAIGNKYLTTEISLDNGATFTNMGSEQLLSVPYALYAQSSAGDTGGNVNIHATGNGTANYISKFISDSTLGNSLIYDNGTNVGIGIAQPAYPFEVIGNNQLAAIFESTDTNGTGVVGVGNNLNAVPVLNGGAGGAFIGNQYGVVGEFTSNSVNETLAGGVFHSIGANSTTYVEAWINGTHYKVIGTAGGTVSTSVPDVNGRMVVLHAPETPEFYFQDYGEGQLVNGRAHIDLDPTIAKNVTINEKHPLRVFVQLSGDCNGVYVTNKTATGFDVVELKGGTSNTPFSWTVVCNVADQQIGDRTSKFADLRFEPSPAAMQSKNASKN